MALTLNRSALRLTQAKFFGNPSGPGYVGGPKHSVGVFNVVAYGAVADDNGTVPNAATDCTAAFQAAINDAFAVGGVVYIPAAPLAYKITATLTIPVSGGAGDYRTFAIVGEGAPSVQKDQSNLIDLTAGPISGSTIHSVVAGAPAIQYLPDYGRMSLRMENFTLIGPDYFPNGLTVWNMTTTSGHGIYVAGGIAPKVVFKNVHVAWFGGGSGIQLGGGSKPAPALAPEGFSLDTIHARFCKYGLAFANYANNGTVTALSAEYNTDRGLSIDDATGITFVAPLVQYNGRTGIYISAAASAANLLFTTPWVEVNNRSNTVGERGILIESSAVVGSGVQSVTFLNMLFAGTVTNDAIEIRGTFGVGANQNIRFIDGDFTVNGPYLFVLGSATSRFEAHGIIGLSYSQIQLNGATETRFYGADGAEQLPALVLDGLSGVAPLQISTPGLTVPAVSLLLTGVWSGGPQQDHGLSIAGARFGSNTNTSLLNITNTDTTPLFRVTDYGSVGIRTQAPTAALHVVGLVAYTNNAAAVAGGLTAGAFYLVTGSDPRTVAVVF